MEAAVVLVVEDEPIVREVLRDTLERAGHRVLEAGDGLEALAVLSRAPVDLVISDVNMPTMDGYGLYDRVRSRPDWITLPFLMLTAVGDPGRARHALELGVDDYLVKPVTSDDLLFAVRTLLNRRAKLEAGRTAQIAVLKDTILTTLAHELRTPLTMVLGYAELLREAAMPAEAEDLHAIVEGVLKGAERLRRLADDLVTLVGLRSSDAYRAHLSRRAPLPNLESLLQEVVQSRRAGAEARRVAMTVAVAPGMPVFEGDATLLAGAVGRLLDNAIKFSKADGGHATIRARPTDGFLTLEVEDDGHGIAPEEQARLAELFYQVDREQNEQQGTGCGLAIAHAVAAIHGGRLEVRSQPGAGSTFSMHLPRPAPS